MSQLIDAMHNCEQAHGVSIMEHGIMVHDAYNKILNGLDSGIFPEKWRIPEWTQMLIPYLMEKDIIEKYHIFHDCGKPYCLSFDKDGKKHFPDHANVSANIAKEISELSCAENLIRMDMDIHLLKSDKIVEFSTRKEWATLILTGIAEVHANAQMFGGLDSDNFKIKIKHIAKRGKNILNYLNINMSPVLKF
jgi:hypothetical protein